MSEAISGGPAGATAAINTALRDLGHNQQWLGNEVAELEGVDPFNQSTVSNWIAKPQNQAPSRIFAIEKVLGRTPGSISRLLGYLPPEAAPVVTVEEAIEADPALTDMARRTLIGAYRAAIRRS